MLVAFMWTSNRVLVAQGLDAKKVDAFFRKCETMALDQKDKELWIKTRQLTPDLAKKHQRKAKNAFQKLRAKNRAMCEKPRCLATVYCILAYWLVLKNFFKTLRFQPLPF